MLNALRKEANLSPDGVRAFIELARFTDDILGHSAYEEIKKDVEDMKSAISMLSSLKGVEKPFEKEVRGAWQGRG